MGPQLQTQSSSNPYHFLIMSLTMTLPCLTRRPSSILCLSPAKHITHASRQTLVLPLVIRRFHPIQLSLIIPPSTCTPCQSSRMYLPTLKLSDSSSPTVHSLIMETIAPRFQSFVWPVPLAPTVAEPCGPSARTVDPSPWSTQINALTMQLPTIRIRQYLPTSTIPSDFDINPADPITSIQHVHPSPDSEREFFL